MGGLLACTVAWNEIQIPRDNDSAVKYLDGEQTEGQ